MAPNIVLVAGLPGCGKSMYLSKLCVQGWVVLDDFKANAYDNDTHFSRSRKYRTLLAAVRDGLRCAAADIDFCSERSRAEAEQALRAELPNVDVEWRFFANDPSACEANARRRNRDSLPEDLVKLAEYSRRYVIPDGAAVIPVPSSLSSMKEE